MNLKSLYLLNTRVVTCRVVGLCGFRNSLLVVKTAGLRQEGATLMWGVGCRAAPSDFGMVGDMSLPIEGDPMAGTRVRWGGGGISV